MQALYDVLLYYKYVKVKDPMALAEAQHAFCVKHNLLGRIIIAHEGINGTVSGLRTDCAHYMRYMQAQDLFKNMDFKVEAHTSHAFQKLNIRIKPEIVRADLHDIDPTIATGDYVSARNFKTLKDHEDVVVVDVRSNYEHTVGTFKGAVTLDINHFREFKHKLADLEQYKDKHIITICTGGIRCEKASAYLLQNGFNKVSQLHNGILRYGWETGGDGFEGKCYVFDNRLLTPVNTTSTTVRGACYHCQTPCERMVNCANPICNIHVPMCVACSNQLEGGCSESCKKHADKRVMHTTGSYAKQLNGYNPRYAFRKQDVAKSQVGPK